MAITVVGEADLPDLLLDVAGLHHLVVEPPDRARAPAQDAHPLALVALAGDGQPALGHLDRDVVALEPGQLHLDPVGAVGLLHVGQPREAAVE